MFCRQHADSSPSLLSPNYFSKLFLKIISQNYYFIMKTFSKYSSWKKFLKYFLNLFLQTFVKNSHSLFSSNRKHRERAISMFSGTFLKNFLQIFLKIISWIFFHVFKYISLNNFLKIISIILSKKKKT